MLGFSVITSNEALTLKYQTIPSPQMGGVPKSKQGKGPIHSPRTEFTGVIKLSTLKSTLILSGFWCISYMLGCLVVWERGQQQQHGGHLFSATCHIFWQVSVFFPVQETALLREVPKARRGEFSPKCIMFPTLPHPTLFKVKRTLQQTNQFVLMTTDGMKMHEIVCLGVKTNCKGLWLKLEFYSAETIKFYMVWRTLLGVKSPIQGITTMVRSKMTCMATPTADPTLQCRESVNVPNPRRLKQRLASSLGCCHFLCMSLSCCCWLRKLCNSDGC